MHISKVCCQKIQQQRQTIYLLALATLGGTTKNRNDPISAAPPKVAKASTVKCRCHYHFHAKLRQLKHGLMIMLEKICFFPQDITKAVWYGYTQCL